MKTTKKHSLFAASLLALAPSAFAQKPDFGLEPRDPSEAAAPAARTSPVPDIKIEIDGTKIQLDGSQIEAMVGEVLKNLANDNGKAAREMLSNLLGVEAGSEAEMLRALMQQIPQIAGEGTGSFELGGEKGIDFEAKAFMIGPDGEQREIEINADEIRQLWDHHHGRKGGAEQAEPVPHPEAEAEAGEDSEMPAFFIGVAVDPAPEALRGHLGLDEGTGVVVAEVFAGSPAAKVGLRSHDVILEVNGKTQGSHESLVEAVRHSGGEPMKMWILRGGKKEEVTVTPAKREQPSVSGLFVPKIEVETEEHSETPSGDELQELREEVKETRKLMERILEKMEEMKGGE